MICTGTGSAPMRAMTERCRRLLKESTFLGKLMLFFGARTERELPYFGPLMNLPKDFIDINLALSREQIGRAHVRTPVTNAQLVCRILLEIKKTNNTYNHIKIFIIVI